MFRKFDQTIRKRTAFGLGIVLLLVPACQSRAIPVTDATPTFLQAPTSTPVPATPTRSILPENSAQVTRRAQLGNGTVHGALKLSPDGKTLAVPTTVGVDLYETETLAKARTLPASTKAGHLAFSPDGSILAMDTTDGVIQLWDVRNGTLLRQLTAGSENAGDCTGLAFSPDGKTAAAGYGRESKTWVWNVEAGKRLYELEGYSLSYAPDGKKLLTVRGDQADTGRKRTITVYDLSDGSPIEQWEARRAEFSSTGALALEQDEAVRVWDFEKDRAAWAFSGRNAAFSVQGDKLALFSRGKVEIYNLTDGTHLQTLEGSYTYADSLLFSPGGEALAGMISTYPSGEVYERGDTLALWQISNGAAIKTIYAPYPTVSYAFTHDGERLVLSRQSTVDFLQVRDGTVAASLGGYAYPVVGIAFSPDGQILAAASAGGSLSVQLWQAADARPLQRLEDPGNVSSYESLEVAFSPDGQTLAVNGDFWQLSTGELMNEFQQKMTGLHPFWSASVAFMPQGRIVALGSVDGYLAAWDFVDQELQHEFKAGYRGEVVSLDVSRDGSWLAAVYGYPDHVIQLWQLPEGQPLNKLSGKHFTRAIFSPDGQTLATLAADEEYEQYGLQAGSVQLWRTEDGQELLRLDLRDVLSLALSPDGQILATGSIDGRVRLWRLGDGQLLQTLQGQSDRVSDLAFSPDGTLLASGSLDGTVLLWGLPGR